jgi:hypothetical protein
MKKMIFINAFSVLFIFSTTALKAQPTIEWQKCLGGSSWDVGRSIQQTSDGGYIVAGYAMSNNGDVTGNHSVYFDLWIVKINEAGTLQWQKCLGGSESDYAFSIQQTTDGGYIVAGETESYNGDVAGNHGVYSYDFWVVKLDTAGNIKWQKCLGGSGGESANSVRQTSDGGFIVAGFTWLSNDGDVTGNHGDFDSWIVKLDTAGNIQWQKCLGGSGRETAYSVRQTNDGGYIVAGNSNSNDGDVTGNHGDFDYWIVKLDATGNIQWQKCLGGSSIDDAFSIQQTTDDGYIIAGSTSSIDGDVTGNHSIPGPYGDGWVVKLDATGKIQWQKCLGGSFDDWAYSVQQTIDGGSVVSCITKSNDGDVTKNHDPSGTYWDYWVVKLDTAGDLKWQRCMGGNEDDETFSIQQTSDGGLIVAGYSFSLDGDVSGNHGGGDYWIVKLSTITPTEESYPTTSFTLFPNPARDRLHLNLDQKAEIKILDIKGKEIKTFTAEPGEISVDISWIEGGMYFMKVGSDKVVTVKKFIKL